MTLASTVNEHLRRPGDAGLSDAKSAIVSALKSLHSGGRFHTTDYFNHSFVPDIVGTWQTATEDPEERFFFLRPTHRADFIGGDLKRLSSVRPAFISLSESDPGLDEIEDALEPAVGDAAISNTYALGVLGAGEGRLRKERLASALFLRRAKGIIGDDEARAVDHAALGFQAAIDAESAGVSESLDVFSRFLQNEASAAINRYMYYLWTGATSAAYPGSAPVDQWLAREEIAEVLRYLLERPQFGSEQYWERLAEQVTLDELEGLGDLRSTDNLQRLMGFAASVLRARGVHVDRADDQPSFDFDQPFAWSIRDRVLQVSDSTTVFRVADDLRRFRGVTEELHGPTMASLRRRLAALQLNEVLLESIGLEADLRVPGGSSTSQRRELDEVVADIDPSAEIVRASVLPLQGGSSYECDFRRSIVQASGDATEPLTNLVPLAATVLADLSDLENSRLREALGLRSARDEFSGGRES